MIFILLQTLDDGLHLLLEFVLRWVHYFIVWGFRLVLQPWEVSRLVLVDANVPNLPKSLIDCDYVLLVLRKRSGEEVKRFEPLLVNVIGLEFLPIGLSTELQVH